MLWHRTACGYKQVVGDAGDNLYRDGIEKPVTYYISVLI